MPDRSMPDRSETHGSAGSQPPHAPAEPRPTGLSKPSPAALPPDTGRLQLAVVLSLIAVLIAIPLYLWRRPRAVADDLAAEAEADAAVAIAAPSPSGAPAATSPAGDAEAPGAPLAAALPLPPGLSLSEPRVTECHDPGPKRTAAKDCDHLLTFERAFAKAIADNAACVPVGASGVIAFAADVSYQRKKQPVIVSLPREGRTMKPAKTWAACAAAMRKSLSAVTLEDPSHQHSRYRIEVRATYAGAALKP